MKAQALAAKLCHDLGKYISRAAVNITSVPFPALVDMLIDDLFATDGVRRASAVFEDLASEIEREVGPQPSLDACRSRLVRIDALEQRLRNGNFKAVQESARLAIEIDCELRAYLRQLK